MANNNQNERRMLFSRLIRSVCLVFLVIGMLALIFSLLFLTLCFLEKSFGFLLSVPMIAISGTVTLVSYKMIKNENDKSRKSFSVMTSIIVFLILKGTLSLIAQSIGNEWLQSFGSVLFSIVFTIAFYQFLMAKFKEQ